jgi:hypothetical protein
MAINDKLAALIARAEQIKTQGTAARGNGVSRLHVAPSPAVDGMMLNVALGKVADAEKALEAARCAARAAARAAGQKVSGLFSGSQFVQRSWAERIADEAREEGANERNALLIKVFKASSQPDPKYDGARRWAAEMLRRRRAAGFGDDVQLTPDQQTALLNGTLAPAADPAAAEDAAEAAEQARIEAEAKIKAEAILAAARLRGSGGPPLPEPTGKAKRILDAAAKVHRKE